MGHRRTPSLHIRFSGHEPLDKIEIWANRKGEKIVPWARQALLNQARYENQQERLQNAANFSTLKMVVLLQEMAGQEAAERAHQEAQKYKDWIKADVAKKFK